MSFCQRVCNGVTSAILVTKFTLSTEVMASDTDRSDSTGERRGTCPATVVCCMRRALFLRCVPIFVHSTDGIITVWEEASGEEGLSGPPWALMGDGRPRVDRFRLGNSWSFLGWSLGRIGTSMEHNATMEHNAMGTDLCSLEISSDFRGSPYPTWRLASLRESNKGQARALPSVLGRPQIMWLWPEGAQDINTPLSYIYWVIITESFSPSLQPFHLWILCETS